MFHPKSLSLLLPFAAALALVAFTAQAATVDVTAYGAIPNGSTDATAAIQSAINASAAGDTVYFPSGTYVISSAITFVSNRNYAGVYAGQVTSILKQTAANAFCGATQYDAGAAINIVGLTFQNGGICFSGSGHVPANGINIQNCTFLNIVSATYPYSDAIYIPIGATNCSFVGNTFTNAGPDSCFAVWNLSGCKITDNTFNGVNECCHTNGTCPNLTIARNVGFNLHRMGIEAQGSGYQNFLVEDNDFSNWMTPYNDSFGLSIVQSSGPNVVTQYNTILGRPAAGSGSRYGFGIEVGSQETVQNNFVEGYFWYGVMIGGANTTITNNILRGPTNGGYQMPSKTGYESGGDPATATFTGNMQINTANYVGAPSSLRASPTSSNGVQLNWVNNPSGTLVGTLSGTVAAGSSSTYNLTSLGTADWAHWNGTYNHKASGGSQISNVTQIGGGSYGTFSQTARNVSWSDGAPVASNADDQHYIWCNNQINAGWTFTVPADTTGRTLNVLYGGASGAGITIKAHLSDGSASDYSNTQTVSASTPTLATFTYNTLSANQTLTVTLTKSDNSGTTSVDLDAAWLTAAGPAGIQVQRRNPGGTYAAIATLPSTATSYTDTTATSNLSYIYRLFVSDTAGDVTYSPAVLMGARKYEAESLTVVNYLSQSGGTARAIGADPNLSNGNGEILDANTIGDYITFLVPNVAAGTYDVRIGVKSYNARGQFQLQGGRADNFSGTAANIGGIVDEYAAGAQYLEIGLGTWAPTSTTDKWFRFTVAGKNAASGGGAYNDALAFDYIKLVPQ